MGGKCPAGPPLHHRPTAAASRSPSSCCPPPTMPQWEGSRRADWRRTYVSVALAARDTRGAWGECRHAMARALSSPWLSSMARHCARKASRSVVPERRPLLRCCCCCCCTPACLSASQKAAVCSTAGECEDGEKTRGSPCGGAASAEAEARREAARVAAAASCASAPSWAGMGRGCTSCTPRSKGSPGGMSPRSMSIP